MKSADEIKPLTLAAMARNHIVLGIVSDLPANVLGWTEGDQRFLTGIGFQTLEAVPLDELRRLFASGRAHVLGEVGVQYSGIPIDDPSLDPLFALAHEFDLPVLVHVQAGGGSPDFPIELGDPLRLAPVLRKYPDLRVQLENAGWPFIEGTTALMYRYPSVYADV